MVQVISLFRKKEDDIWAIFILQFFKLIGCIIQDCIITDEEKTRINVRRKNDLNILLNITEEEIEISEKYRELTPILKAAKEGEKAVCYVTIPQKEISMEIIRRMGYQVLYEQIIQKTVAWNEEAARRDLQILTDTYVNNDLFYFLYNKGNLKFVQEYYPVSGENESVFKERREAFRQTFQVYAECYNHLSDKKTLQEDITQYYRYALVKLGYKLNDIDKMLEGDKVFRTQDLLEQLEQLLLEYPDFARVGYLAASICMTDSEYLWQAEVYYIKSIGILKGLYENSGLEGFLYYQLGRYYEKIKKDMEQANVCYKEANVLDYYMHRALYKQAIQAEKEGKYQDTVDKCNEIIHLILNGYQMNEIMPKQQIYVYKGFVLMGDAYYKAKDYDLAEKCYQNAVRIMRAGSLFFDKLRNVKDDKYLCFEAVLRGCMPIQPVYLKMVSCATKSANVKRAQEYLEELNNIQR